MSSSVSQHSLDVGADAFLAVRWRRSSPDGCLSGPNAIYQALVGLWQSFRRATITRAKLARAYANAGQPDEACRVAWETLDAIEQIDSQSARSELRRAIPVLNQWHGRRSLPRLVTGHRSGAAAAGD
ncbi:MAG: hypothetical protein ACRDTD_00885 [Pseudonocardiaceae bacterium]